MVAVVIGHYDKNLLAGGIFPGAFQTHFSENWYLLNLSLK